MEQTRDLVFPGPVDHSVLRLQSQHRSTTIWERQEETVLTCRRSDRALYQDLRHLHPRVLRYLLQAGFYGLHSIGFIQLDHHLITALVERWRQETHTFHLPVGESSITLQDVAILSGLPIDGEPVTGVDTERTIEQWQALCHDLVGLTPQAQMIRGSRLRLSWLTSHFHSLPPEADEETVRCHARACILFMIGACLCADKSQNMVKLMYLPLLQDLEAVGRLSWGGAALACLYREMCRATRASASDIGGPLILLQLWAWERLAHIRPERTTAADRHVPPPKDEVAGLLVDANGVSPQPDPLPRGPLGCRWHSHFTLVSTPTHSLRHYRDQLDRMREEQMIWQPYTPEVIKVLPAYCLVGQDIWQTSSPLICFDVVELHLPERVLRQFGIQQNVPPPCDTVDILHNTDRRGRSGYNWEVVHEQYVTKWRQRRVHIVDGEFFSGRTEYNDPYLVWYRRITRMLILPLSSVPHTGFQPLGSVKALLIQTIQRIYQTSTAALAADDASVSMLAHKEVVDMCQTSLAAINEDKCLIHQDLPLAQPVESIPSLPAKRARGIVVPHCRKRRTRKGQQSEEAAEGSLHESIRHVPSESGAIEQSHDSPLAVLQPQLPPSPAPENAPSPPVVSQVAPAQLLESCSTYSQCRKYKSRKGRQSKVAKDDSVCESTEKISAAFGAIEHSQDSPVAESQPRLSSPSSVAPENSSPVLPKEVPPQPPEISFAVPRRRKYRTRRGQQSKAAKDGSCPKVTGDTRISESHPSTPSAGIENSAVLPHEQSHQTTSPEPVPTHDSPLIESHHSPPPSTGAESSTPLVSLVDPLQHPQSSSTPSVLQARNSTSPESVPTEALSSSSQLVQT